MTNKINYGSDRLCMVVVLLFSLLSASFAQVRRDRASGGGAVTFILDDKKYVMAGNGDVISVSEARGRSRNSDDILVSNNTALLLSEQQNHSVWKGGGYPSVFYFPIGKHMLHREYRNNNRMLMALDELLQSRTTVESLDTVEIIGACSPSGGESYNMKLALSRCMALRSYLRWKHLELVEHCPIKFTVIGIDWAGYNILKETRPSLSTREIWDLLQYSAIRLKMTDGSYLIPGVDRPLQQVVEPERKDTVYIETRKLPVKDTVARSSKQEPATFFALKTNLLYDVALLPNLTAEWYIGKQWSLAVEGDWNWWSFGAPVQSRSFYRIQALGVEARKWFASPGPLRGHALGAYGMIGNYDVRLFPEDETYSGWLSYQSWSGGLSYAYSHSISRKMNLELGLAVGYLGGRYYRYDYCMKHEEWTRRESLNRNYFGPTRIGVSLVWLLSGYNEKK